MHQQSLILLHPTVKEKMHLQENTLFYLDLWVKVTQNGAQCPLHHVTYAPTEFEVTTPKGLGGDAFTKKFNICTLTLTLGSRSNKMLPSTLYIMWPIQLQSLKLLRQPFRRRYIYKKCDGRTSARTHIHTHGRMDRRKEKRGYINKMRIRMEACSLYSSSPMRNKM